MRACVCNSELWSVVTRCSQVQYIQLLKPLLQALILVTISWNRKSYYSELSYDRPFILLTYAFATALLNNQQINQLNHILPSTPFGRISSELDVSFTQNASVQFNAQSSWEERWEIIQDWSISVISSVTMNVNIFISKECISSTVAHYIIVGTEFK
jgi:hypothetical protein